MAPAPVVNIVAQRIRRLSKDLILPYEEAPLKKHLEGRARDDIALNINVLGEAVLGESEADERFERVLEVIRRPEINYVSVKLSSIVSQSSRSTATVHSIASRQDATSLPRG